MKRIWTYVFVLFWLLCGSSAAAETFNPKTVYKKVSPRVVLITGFEPGQMYQGMGTGSIIRKDGLVLTNAHVVFNAKAKRPWKQLRVFLKPSRITGNLKKDTQKKYTARLLVYNNDLDLALLQIEGRPSQGYDTIGFIDSGRVEIGDRVLAIGHPESGGLWTLTTGTISSQVEDFQNIAGKHVFQTETSLNRGNSGGPLLDNDGLMVGINSNIARQSKDGLAITDINFSIQSNVAVKWLNDNGYSFDYSQPQTMVKLKTETIQPSGITPQPKKEEHSSESQLGNLKKEKTLPRPKPETVVEEPQKETVVEKSEPGTGKEDDNILTEKRPFKLDDLFSATEEEMEDMMEDVKTKMKRKKKDRFNFDDF